MADDKKSDPADPKGPAKPKTPKTPKPPESPAAGSEAGPGETAEDRTTAAGAGAEQSAEGPAGRRSETRDRMGEAARNAQGHANRAASAAREEASRSYSEARTSISDSDDRMIAIVAYVLFLATFVTGGVAAIVGVILAYLKKDTIDPVLAGHFDYLIRTFWIGLVGALVCFLLIFVIIGIPLIFALGVWWLLRMVIGLVRLLDGKPIPDPKTWLV